MKDLDFSKLIGTKAETLENLINEGFNIPPLMYFNVNDWKRNEEAIVLKIISDFGNSRLAIRSSAKAEDTEEFSMAGAFESILNVLPNNSSIKSAINSVINSFDTDLTNQVLVQPMVKNVKISGVLMTQVLDDGSPYYVINYDDTTGLTDTVTSGKGVNKTVYIYNGVNPTDFDSIFLLNLLTVVKELQEKFSELPLDIEFAINNDLEVFILQVRRITTSNKWKAEINNKVSDRMVNLREFIDVIMKPRPYLYGDTTLLGIMPDWNPAEMIGVVPRPLAHSLYRKLITESSWRLAREKMGYRKMPSVELMFSLYGRVYIDVRNSINSFLPDGLCENISKKLANAYLSRLKNNPHLHDKIEFEVIYTAYDFDFDNSFNERYPNLLSEDELREYKNLLFNLTSKAINNEGSLQTALSDIEYLKSIQSSRVSLEDSSSFSLVDNINTLISECKSFGTIPFSILARHGFIAEGLIRSMINNKAISNERIKLFRRSINTVASEMSVDFIEATKDARKRSEYLNKYGHLRPSSYDILSPNYLNRSYLFENGNLDSKVQVDKNFYLSTSERKRIDKLLEDHHFNLNSEDLFAYLEKAIVSREYAKFIFTKHLNDILELTAKWGEFFGFSRNEVSMLSIDDVLSQLISPLNISMKGHFMSKIARGKENYEVANSFKLSYLIRSVRDVHIVPMQRSSANFISDLRIENKIIHLTPYSSSNVDLEGKIVCIEGADPGYDWIFTRNIAGLITKYGGANSHMAIRSAEYGIPAAIGCGDQPFERIIKAGRCLLDCQSKQLIPIEI